MAVLSNTQIRQYLKSGQIVCTPFDPGHVSYASLDVTLGYYYYRTDRLSEKVVYNPLDEDEVLEYFDGPNKAIPHHDWCKQNHMRPLKNIPPDHPIIPLKPGERILAHTNEFFGIKPPGAYEVKSRSSWGRNGIAVCFDAGWVDPNYINRLTLEIFNLNQHRMIILPVGERIAQAVFHDTGPVEGAYGAHSKKNYTDKYQHGTNLEEIIKNWSPEQMLPRAYLDKRRKPAKVKGLQGD